MELGKWYCCFEGGHYQAENSNGESQCGGASWISILELVLLEKCFIFWQKDLFGMCLGLDIKIFQAKGRLQNRFVVTDNPVKKIGASNYLVDIFSQLGRRQVLQKKVFQFAWNLDAESWEYRLSQRVERQTRSGCLPTQSAENVDEVRKCECVNKH